MKPMIKIPTELIRFLSGLQIHSFHDQPISIQPVLQQACQAIPILREHEIQIVA
jgi:hypothetical protein